MRTDFLSNYCEVSTWVSTRQDQHQHILNVVRIYEKKWPVLAEI